MPLEFVLANENDFDHLVELRIDAMRESLEKVGRFDRQRSRDRFQTSFVANETTKIFDDNVLVGFYAYAENPDHIFLSHLYVVPAYQSKGIGAAAMSRVIEVSNRLKLPIRLGALKESRSNDFYKSLDFKVVSEDEWDIHYERAAS